jgi:hypothetical protein
LQRYRDIVLHSKASSSESISDTAFLAFSGGLQVIAMA